MSVNGVILRKLEALDEVLGELRSLGKVTARQLREDWRLKRAIERDLQVLVEIVVDVCQRLLSLAGESPVTSGGEAVQRCTRLGALSQYEPYRLMVQFRNFFVHRYEQADDEILVGMVNRHLEDFERFRREILVYVRQKG